MAHLTPPSPVAVRCCTQRSILDRAGACKICPCPCNWGCFEALVRLLLAQRVCKWDDRGMGLCAGIMSDIMRALLAAVRLRCAAA